jgi:hypothetical protein
VKHYIAMSGMHGCLPDYCEVHEALPDAINDLVNLFELGRERTKALRQAKYLELVRNPVEIAEERCFGADYCEITACDCDTPEVHSDSL